MDKALTFLISITNLLLIRTIAGRAPRNTAAYVLPEADGTPFSLTFCTVPYTNITYHQYKMYKTTFFSYLHSSPLAKLMIFAERELFDPNFGLIQDLERQFGSDRVIFAGNMPGKIPLISDWFKRGFELSTTNFTVFINSDIAVSSEWYDIVTRIYQFFNGSSISIMGQRINFDLEDDYFNLLNFSSPDYIHQLESVVSISQHVVHDSTGVDFFGMNSNPTKINPDDIPPFIMGRFYWDTWLTGYLNKFTKSVTLNHDPPIYHVNHVRHKLNKALPAVKKNFELYHSRGRYRGSNDNTVYSYEKGKLYFRE